MKDSDHLLSLGCPQFSWGVSNVPMPRAVPGRVQGRRCALRVSPGREPLTSSWGFTHRSFLPLGFCFPARARSSSSEGCLYRKRLKANRGGQESLGMDGISVVNLKS